MEVTWWVAISIIVGGLIVLLFSGMPVFAAFIMLNVLGVFLWWGGEVALRQLILSIYRSVADFTLVTIGLFVLMGTVTFHSGLGLHMIDTVDKWLGRLPGRLALVAVASGTVLSTLSGSSIATTALLGSVLTPEMEKRGYKKPMSLGPVMGSGGLAMMIPPSSMAVFIAAVAEVSIAGVLIGGIMPGLIMAALYASYIVIRCWLQPSIAPPYEPPPTPLSERIAAIAKYVLPLALIVFLVTGVILLGIATPSEAAATGTLGTFVLAASYKRLNWEVVKKAVTSATELVVMILMILTGTKAFGQILVFSGASAGLVEWATSSGVSPMVLVIVSQFVLAIFGMFGGQLAMIMVIVPIMIPILEAGGLSGVWYCVLTLLNQEMAGLTPPFGLIMFTMKGVAPPDTTMDDIVKAALPFVYGDIITMILMIAFPAIVLWLPSMVR